jgi:hypothetical protein
MNMSRWRSYQLQRTWLQNAASSSTFRRESKTADCLTFARGDSYRQPNLAPRNSSATIVADWMAPRIQSMILLDRQRQAQFGRARHCAMRRSMQQRSQQSINTSTTSEDGSATVESFKYEPSSTVMQQVNSPAVCPQGLRSHPTSKYTGSKRRQPSPCGPC